MREKIILSRRTSSKIVTLPNGTTFTARYERIDRKALPMNIRERKMSRRPAKKSKKKVRFTPSSSLRERLARINRYTASRLGQTGSALASNLAELGIKMGSKALNSALGKKIINKGIGSIPDVSKYGVSRIKNKKVQWALNSDIANYIVDEAQNKVKSKTHILFG